MIHRSVMYTLHGILYTLYGRDCREEKKRQNMAKWSGHQNSNNNFRDSFLNIDKYMNVH